MFTAQQNDIFTNMTAALKSLNEIDATGFTTTGFTYSYEMEQFSCLFVCNNYQVRINYNKVLQLETAELCDFILSELHN